MPLPNPDDSIGQILLNWSGAAAAAFAGLLWKMQNSKVDELAKRLDAALAENRENALRLFDKLDSNARRSDDRHVELMSALHAGLEGKVDKP